MSGLEKILKHIEDTAQNKANELIQQANNEADLIIDEANKTAEEKYNKIIAQSKIDVENYIKNSEAFATLSHKKIILDTKQVIIKDIIELAKEYIIKLPDKEYFNILLKMLKKNCMAKSGQIVFSQYDKKRMPEGFRNEINKIVSGINGASLTISEETCDIDGGFILNYGDIEQNCSFDAMFLDKKDLLQDEVYKLLFEEKAV